MRFICLLALSVCLFVSAPAVAQEEQGSMVYTGIWDFFFPNSRQALEHRYEIIIREIRARESRKLGTFADMELQVRFTSVLDLVADAYVIPRTGSGKAGDLITEVVSWEAQQGLEEYNKIAKERTLEWGDAVLTSSGEKSNARHLIQTRIATEVSEVFTNTDADITRYKNIVALGVQNSLMEAHKAKLATIALPPLAAFNWDGISLSPYHSAEAVGQGISQFVKIIGATPPYETTIRKITVGVYPDSRFVDPAHQFLAYEGEFSRMTGIEVVQPVRTMSLAGLCRAAFLGK